MIAALIWCSIAPAVAYFLGVADGRKRGIARGWEMHRDLHLHEIAELRKRVPVRDHRGRFTGRAA